MVPIHIGIAYDQNYLPQFYALAASIFANNPKNSLVIHAIVTGVSQAAREKITKYVSANKASIHYYQVDEEQMGKYVRSSAWTAAVYYRLMFPFLIPKEVQRLIYIDTDTLVLNDLNRLYQQDLGNHPVGAVYDSYVKKQELLGIHEEGEYFNSGVMVMDVPEWNKQRISEQCFEYLTKYPERIRYVDQCALNAVLKNNWKKMDYRMNCMYSNLPDGMNRRQRISFISEIVVLHFTLQRPWNYLCQNPYRHLYSGFLRKSGYAKKVQKVDFKWNKVPSKIKIEIVELYHESGMIKKAWRSLRGKRSV
jgi:lipopolysaccharide biosynthesis glycosyltransferase